MQYCSITSKAPFITILLLSFYQHFTYFVYKRCVNTRAFLIAVIIILLVIISYMSFTAQQPLRPEGSLKNVEISPTPIGETEPTISGQAVGLP